jgi:hypothetical protein
MNKGIYKIGINNCSNNSVLFEDNEKCVFKNDTYNNINKFFNKYFNEVFLVPYSCHNCYYSGISTLNEAITDLSIFFMLNSFLIIIYIYHGKNKKI